MHNLLDLSYELINPNLFFNLIDISFGYDKEKRKNFPIAILLSIF